MTITGGTDVRAPAGPSRLSLRWVDAVIGLGLVLLVAGTFLPWLRSGRVERNSYSADGAIRRLLDLHGVTGAALAAWPFLSLLCAVAGGLLIAGLVRTGATLAALGAFAVGVVCVTVLVTRSSATIDVTATGPVFTLAGCVLVVATVLLSATRRPRRNR